MKQLALIVFLFTLPLYSWTQCYTGYRDNALLHARKGMFKEAYEFFGKAKDTCKTDKPSNGDAEIKQLIAATKKLEEFWAFRKIGENHYAKKEYGKAAEQYGEAQKAFQGAESIFPDCVGEINRLIKAAKCGYSCDPNFTPKVIDLTEILRKKRDDSLFNVVKHSLDPGFIRQVYLDQCPSPCAYETQANNLIDELERDERNDAILWGKVATSNSMDSIEKYYIQLCTRFKKCRYLPDALDRIAGLKKQREEYLWSIAKKSEDPFIVRDSYLLKTELHLHKKEALDLIDSWIKNSRPKLVPIPGGIFEIGDVLREKGGGDNEKSHKNVSVADFLLGDTEVTFSDFDLFCYATNRPRPVDPKNWGRGRRPVIQVDWYDAVEYCNWRSEIDGLKPVYRINKETVSLPHENDKKKWEVTADPNANGYRLPTEAEWEYAARNGGKAVRFGNGLNTASTPSINFDGSAVYANKVYSSTGEYRGQTVPVGSLKSPNALGLHDMSGNVFEWCWNAYQDSHKNFYTTYGAGFLKTPGSGKTRVAKGGAWNSSPASCRNAYRYHWSPDADFSYLGFRIARNK